MSHLDPFIVYTVKLAMDFKSSSVITTRSANVMDERSTMIQNDSSHPSCHETVARILSMKSIPLNPGEKAPKLKKENMLTLLYHADEQWSQSVKELVDVTQSHNASIEHAVDNVHHQQSIFLDTVHLLHKTMLTSQTPSSYLLTNTPPPKRFSEPIWFAAQVLHQDCQIRHLEYFTDILQPLATNLRNALEDFRLGLRDALTRQNELKKFYEESKSLCKSAAKRFSIWSLFTANPAATSSTSLLFTNSSSFYKSPEHLQFLQTELAPALVKLIHHWTLFENKLYACYVHAVFGEHHVDHIQDHKSAKTSSTTMISSLSSTTCYDSFTQLLPLTLERALKLGIMDLNMIQSLDPVAFVALPRLAILAGVTWLSHLTGWRDYRINSGSMDWIVQSHLDTMECITTALVHLEVELLRTQSEDSHHAFVKTYQRLERALVHGQQQQGDDEDDNAMLALEKEIYLDICLVADSILSSHYSRSFNAIVCQLFKQVGQQYDFDIGGSEQEDEEEQDAQPIELTLLELAI
ncbi:MAG: hypothetical protein EXX96DRAFT_139290 [Benjaminiella poitrasii]|nr:MAG: hypothetical protein EXX96DRAFT_139290 [Benjaminiella poitrasii]